MADQAVLRTEESDKRHARGMAEELERGASLGVHAGVIGDEPNVLAAQRGKLFRLEDIEARSHASRVCRARHSEKQNEAGHSSADDVRQSAAREWQFERPEFHKALMICWNAHAAAALFPL